MIFSTRSFPIITAILLGVSAFAASSDRILDVLKSDGSIDRYQLLPVQYDPAHASIVEKRLAAAAPNGPSVPAQYEIPHQSLPEIRDQGHRGTCAYFATVGVLETYYMAQARTSPINLSEECLVDVRNWMFDQGSQYTGADKPKQRPDPEGDLPDSIIMTIQNNGVPFSEKYDSVANCQYDKAGGTTVSLQNYQSLFSMSSHPTLAFGKGLSFDQSTAPTLQAIKSLISQNTPVEVGIVVYQRYFNETHWGYNDAIDHDDSLAGAHAVMLTGYTTNSGGTVFTFKNSWGLYWGEDGYGTIDDKLLVHSWGYDPTLDFIVSLHN